MGQSIGKGAVLGAFLFKKGYLRIILVGEFFFPFFTLFSPFCLLPYHALLLYNLDFLFLEGKERKKRKKNKKSTEIT